MKRLLGVLVVLVLALGAAQPVGAAAAKRDVPTREQWIKDVKTAMRGSTPALRARVADAGVDEQLAINFDIDNSTISTYYDGEDAAAIKRVKRYADLATSLGVGLVFNTGRIKTQRARTIAQLTDAGYPVAMLCMRKKGETIPHGKQRCRDRFAEEGWTLVANVGNNPTDFVGDGYEVAYQLPNYDGELG